MSFKADRAKALLKVAAPCILEQFLLVLVNMISISVIGQLGRSELVASSMTNQLVIMLQCIYVGFSMGGTIIISRMWGEGDKTGVKKCFAQSLVLTLFMSVFILFIVIAFRNSIINLFFSKAEEDVLSSLHIYFYYCMIGMPATALSNIFNASVRGVGDNKTPLISTVMLNFINLVLCLAFIKGIPALSIPPMGIRGAGIAIASARYISALFTVAYVYIKKSPIIPALASFTIENRIVLKIIKLGLPSAFEQLVFQGGFVILQTLIIDFGTVFQAGYQIGGNISGIIMSPSTGLGIALTVLISQALGRTDINAADELVHTARRITFILFISLGALLFIFAPIIMRIYTSDPEVIKSGTVFSRMYGVDIIAIAYIQVMSGILRGSGDVKYVAVTSVAGLWVMRIFGVYALARLTGNGYIAVIVGVSSDFLLRSVLYHIRVQRGKWRFIRI